MVASTLAPKQGEFVPEEVNSEAYQQRHMGMVFEEGFSFSGFERDKVWLRTEKGYLDVSAVSGANDENDGRALVVADFDDDGDPDFFVHNTQRERHHLYRNDVGDSSGNGYVKIRLRATRGPAEAMGAIVRARFGGRTVAQLLAFGSGFVSQNAPELVFGLGDADSAEIEVRWPGRAVESFGSLRAGGSYLLVEGRGEAEEIPRHTFRFRDPPKPGLRVRAGERPPELVVLPAAGGEARPLALEGRERPLLVNVWATWCKACLSELPLLERLEREGRYDVVLLGADPPSSREAARRLLEKRAPSVEAYFLSDEEASRWFDLERLPLPTTLFLEDGKVTRIVQGALPESTR